MGYCTWFTGQLRLDRKLAPHHLAYLRAFSETQHAHWDTELLKDVPDPLREAVGLPLGENGCYFMGHSSRDHFPWQDADEKIFLARLGGLCPGKPDHFCAWMPNDDGTELIIAFDKPYGYLKWLQWLLDHFLIPWDYVLNGKMTWQGEYEDDTGVISVEQNVITVHQTYDTNSDEQE